MAMPIHTPTTLKKTKRWPWVLVLLLGSILLVFGLRALNLARPAAGRHDLKRVEVTRRNLFVTKTATGEVTPQNRVEIKPPIAGRVEEVLVREGESVTKGQVLAWMSSAERAALLDAARAEGKEALARWESAYKPAPLISPLDGTVIVRAVEPGQTVTTSDPIVVIADRLIVKAQVDETDIGAVTVGQPATISLDAYPQQQIPSKVDHVAYEAKTVNNVTIYEVDVLPEQVPDVMRSGMTANVTFITSSKPNALVVPAEAIHQEQGSNGTSVLVPGERGLQQPVHKSVTIGTGDGKSIEIISGLQEGDVVLAPSMQLPQDSRNRSNSPLSPFGVGRRGAYRRSQ